MLKSELKTIPIESLKSGKYQTRQIFEKKALQELAESIKAEGIIQPIIVRPTTNSEYEIIAGERRWRAAQILGLEVLSCLVGCYTDEQAAAITPIENVQREDLNPIEEARAYLNLIDDFKYTHEEVATIVGKSREKITNILRLLKLDVRVQELLVLRRISEAYGKILAGLPSYLQYGVAIKCIEHAWSTRKLEQEIKKLQLENSNISKAADGKDPNICVLEKLISNQIGSEVRLETDKNKTNCGWLKIRYSNNEILTGILDKLGIAYDE